MKGDDLFEKSSMSFGEHLEELRRAIAKAAIWLAVGFLIGLPLATSVVDYMQTPLRTSIEDFYKKKSLNEMKETSGKEVSEDLAKWMSEQKVIREFYFAEPDQVGVPIGKDGVLAVDENAKRLPEMGRLRRYERFVKIDASTEALGLQEPFMIWLKAAFVVAVVVASPGIFYHLWEFVSAGLYPHERRYVYFFLPTSLVLFWAGAFLAFFVIFKLVIDFLLEFNASMGIGASPRLSDYMSFALMLPLGFGISFQLPLAMLVLERLGIFSAQMYVSQWRIAVLAIAFISMVLTPADFASMIGMGVPLVGLYFLGIAMCAYLPRGSMMSGAGSDPR